MDMTKNEMVPERFKEWFRSDLRHVEEWRKEAKIDYEFRDGHQWTDDEMATLEDQNRPVITMNRIGTVIDAVCGAEISNRQEVRYIPREVSDTKPSELYTSASRWFRDRADADDNDSEAFRDTVTGGMGWTETRLDYESNPDGDMVVERLDPFEMVWDYNSRKQNLVDANRVWRVRSIPMPEARAMFPGLEDDEINAEWAASGVFDGGSPHISEDVRNRSKPSRGEDGELLEAVVVHCQWIERETVYRVVAPNTGQSVLLKQGELDQLVKTLGIERDMLEPVAQKRKVRYSAFLGNKVLRVGPTACPDKFNFQCITAKRDQVKRQWFGLVRPMRDPQAWANKFFSQILHIINANAKGGIVAERGAFEDDRDAEDSWAKSDRITWLQAGGNSGPNPKWAPKPQTQFPQGLNYMMEFAVSSTRDVVGVNLELLGMREADQAGVLEYQRRQAGMTILQPIFDALKAYRREQGELILHYIKNDLSDGRLVRILGRDEGRYVPLMKTDDALEYDLIVDDMPTSPNHKEMVWQMITQIMPFIKDMMTPEVMLRLAKWSPLPTAVVSDLQEIQDAASKGPMAQLQQRMAMLEAAVREGEAKLKHAQADKASADAKATMLEAGQGNGKDPGAELQLKAADVVGRAQLDRDKARADMQLKADRQASEMVLKAEQQAFDQDMRSAEAEHAAALRQQEADQREALAKQQTKD